MLFTDITDSEMLIFRYIQRANGPVSMVEVMDAMNEQYETDWKRSTVCTFLTHLVEKGYIKMERKGRIFYYQSIINDKKFIDFFFDGSGEEMIRTVEKLMG